MNQVPFEKALVGWRAKLGLTQKELAEELGVTQAMVSLWESGKAKARAVTEWEVRKWAQEKGVGGVKWSED